VVVVPLQEKERHPDVATRVRSSMERFQRDFKVVRRHRRLFMENGDLRTSESPTIL
jgi:ribosomal protein L36